MNRRTLYILIAISAVLAIGFGSFWALGTRDVGEDGFRETPQAAWAERLKPRLGDVRFIHIERKGEEITLERRNGTWRVTQFHGYPARPDAVTTLFDDLARIEAPFVSEVPLSHAKYGVANAPGSMLGAGTKLELRDGEGTVLADLVLGQTVHIPGSEDIMEAQAVRRASEDRIWLFRPTIRLSSLHKDWINSQIVEVVSSDVTKLTTVSKENGETWTLERDADQGIVSSGPQGDTRLSERESINVERLMGGFANLRFDDVREIAPEETATKWTWKTSIETVDGIVYEARLWDEDGDHWMSVAAQPAGRVSEDVAEKIAVFNDHYDGWAYQLSPAITRNLIIDPQDIMAER